MDVKFAKPEFRGGLLKYTSFTLILSLLTSLADHDKGRKTSLNSQRSLLHRITLQNDWLAAATTRPDRFDTHCCIVIVVLNIYRIDRRERKRQNLGSLVCNVNDKISVPRL